MKKKVLIIEPLSPKGHEDINNFMLCNLSIHYDVLYITQKNYLINNSFNLNRIDINDNCCKNNKGPIISRLKNLLFLIKVLKAIRNYRFDSILFLSFETISTSIFLNCFSKLLLKKCRNINLLVHNNIDEVNISTLKKHFFQAIPQYIKLIAYEEYISDYIIKDFKKTSITVHHQLNSYKLNYSREFDRKKIIDKFWDEKYIKILLPNINFLTQSNIKNIYSIISENKNIRLITKSESKQYESGNILYFGNHWSEEEYAYLFDVTDYIMIYYDSRFYNFRISGIFFDALTFKKPVIYNEIPFFKNIEIQTNVEFGFKISTNDSLKFVIENFENLHDSKKEIFKKSIFELQQRYTDEIILNEISNNCIEK